MALRLTGLTNLLYEVASASTYASSLWPVYSKGFPLEPTAAEAWLIHTISFGLFGCLLLDELNGVAVRISCEEILAEADINYF